MSEQMTAANKEKLVSDLKVVISDTEELLRATAGAAGEKVGELRERLGVRLRDAKERRSAVKKQYEQYKAEQERIAAIARAASAKAQGSGTAGVPIQIGSGGLAWPTPGAGRKR